MYKLMIVSILAVFTLVFVPVTATPAAAQCTYDLAWDFNTPVFSSEWENPTTEPVNKTFSTADGHNAPGMMTLETDNTFTTLELSRESILYLLALDTNSTILANGIYVSAWGSFSNVTTAAQRVYIEHENGMIQASWNHQESWGEMAFSDVSDDFVKSIRLQTQPVSTGASLHSSNWDDIFISIPCENVQSAPVTATPTATPEGTPAPTAVPTLTPIPGPTYTPVWNSEVVSMPVDFENPFLTAGGLPQPIPIPDPPPGQEIDVSVFWDYQLLSDFISIIMTMFVLVKKHYIMQAVLVVAVFSLVLVWLVRMVRGRQVNI